LAWIIAAAARGKQQSGAPLAQDLDVDGANAFGKHADLSRSTVRAWVTRTCVPNGKVRWAAVIPSG
jgi:hypothetical protein